MTSDLSPFNQAILKYLIKVTLEVRLTSQSRNQTAHEDKVFRICAEFCCRPQTHHDDADTDADPANDVQFVVEHLVDGSRTALTEQEKT